MRFTQFGHQVPRRNSNTKEPCESNAESENTPSRFAAGSEKSGACEPSFIVSVKFRISYATLKHRLATDNSARRLRTSGDKTLIYNHWFLVFNVLQIHPWARHTQASDI
jgi:hypothetical protein